MVSETNLAAEVGFRHVIEDALSVLSKHDIDPDRRSYVLEDLANLLRDASRGADLVNRRLLFVKSDERNAFDTFSLLDRYLGYGIDSNWREKPPDARMAFTQLQKNMEVPEKARATAMALLRDLLTTLERQSGMSIPKHPEEIGIAE